MMDRPSLLPESIDFLGMAGLRRKKGKRDKKYATFNRRMLAATIDSLLLLIIAPFFDKIAPIDHTAFEKYPANTQDPAVMHEWLINAMTDHAFVTTWFINMFLQFFTLMIFSGVCWHYWSATPGKMLVRIKVVDATTEGKISLRQIIVRLLGYWVSGLPLLLGFLWIGIDKRRQAWHDKLANTVVITQPWKRASTADSATAHPSDSQAP